MTLDVALPATQSDAFGRLRVSSTDTVFDSKMVSDDLTLFWDDAEVTGTGTTSTHNVNRAAVVMGVALNTAGLRRRQTFQRFNYQPGKSQLIMMTGVLLSTGGGAGISASMGLFDDDDGIFASSVDGAVQLTIRSNVTGTPVDTTVAQADWNGDKLDGSGVSGVTLDGTKAQILFIDFEWLGVGTVRVGFIVDGVYIVAHRFQHANIINSVYMSTPNLPLRYELENDGTGPASELEHICCTVISEGGQASRAQLLAATTGGIGITPSNLAVAAAIGIRLKTSNLGKTVDINNISVVNEGNTPGFEWRLYWNPTVAGTFTYADVTNSAVQVAIGNAAGTNTLTGGTLVAAGVSTGSKNAGVAETDITSALRLGAAIDGTRDEIVLAVVPYGAQGELDAALNWSERT